MTPEIQMNRCQILHLPRICGHALVAGRMIVKKHGKKTQEHILICPGYSELRHDKDLTSDGDLVRYFREVIQFGLYLPPWAAAGRRNLRTVPC